MRDFIDEEMCQRRRLSIAAITDPTYALDGKRQWRILIVVGCG